MSQLNVPLQRPQPDAGAFLKAVTTDWEPDRPRLVEYLVNAPVMPTVVEMTGRQWVNPGPDRASQEAYWDNFIAFWHHMGYDSVRLELAMAFPRPGRAGITGAPMPRRRSARSARGRTSRSTRGPVPPRRASSPTSTSTPTCLMAWG